MNTELFNELYKLIKTKFPKKELKSDIFFYYLINGSPFGESTNIDKFPKSISGIISGHKKLRSIFKGSYPLILESSRNLRLETLISHYYKNYPKIARQIKESILTDECGIKKLYESYLGSAPKDQNSEKLLLHLFTECITEKRKSCFASYKNQKMKPTSAECTVGREKDVEKLDQALKSYSKIIISDQYGAGKSHFIKYYLYKHNDKDHCYICYQDDLDSTLRKIRFLDDSDGECTHASYNDLMDPAYKEALLIIDNMYLSPDFSKELQLLASFAVKVIVVTTCDLHFESFYDFHMAQLSDSELQGIFEHYSEIPLENEQNWVQLLRLTQRNVLMISLIAYQCKKLIKLSSASMSLLDTLHKVFTQMDMLSNRMNFEEKGTYTYKHIHDAKTLDLIGHIKYIYMGFFDAASRYKSYEKEKSILKILCCFGWSPIPHAFVHEILYKNMPTYKKYLISLSELGLLQLTDSTVQMTPLISHAVIAAENPSPEDKNYRELCLYLKKFLQEYDLTLSVPYVSDILIVFARTLYNNVRSDNNPGQKTTASFFEDWQDLMYLIHDYYSQNGVVNYADELSRLIKYPSSQKNTHSEFDTSFFALANNMQIDPAKTEIIDQIEKTLSSITSSPDCVGAINPTCFFINCLDTIIGLYCSNLFSSYDTTPDLMQYQWLLIVALEKLVNAIPFLQEKTKVHLSAEKMKYYKLCSKFMLSCPTLSYFSEKSDNIKKWTNINYRIRGTAFLTILESWYIFELYKPELPSLYNSCLVPEMTYIRSQIQECNLLPNQTFKLCLFAYISTAMVKYCCASIRNPAWQNESSINFTDGIKELVNRTPLPKEEYENYILEIEKYSHYFDARTS